LTFNAELLGGVAEVRKRGIARELLHLKVPNHRKRLRALLRAYLSNDAMTEVRNQHIVADIVIYADLSLDRALVGLSFFVR
jgi:hypothetical protein